MQRKISNAMLLIVLAKIKNKEPPSTFYLFLFFDNINDIDILRIIRCYVFNK